MELDKWAKNYAKLLKDTNQPLPERFIFDIGFSTTMPEHLAHIDDAYKLARMYYDKEGE